MNKKLNNEVTKFLDEINHPHRNLIDELRNFILENNNLIENIKWNSPNYIFLNKDIITMKLFPQKQVQIILHRGAKVKEQPKERPLKNEYDIIDWKANDRAVITFYNLEELNEKMDMFKDVIKNWIEFINKTNL